MQKYGGFHRHLRLLQKGVVISMCLSTLYNKTQDAEHVLLKNVQSLRFAGGSMFFIDLMNREYKFEGELISADLVNGSVIVDISEVPMT